MGCTGSPATATTRPPRNGPIHRQVRAPSKSDCAVVGVAMACAPSSPAIVFLLTAHPLCSLRSTLACCPGSVKEQVKTAGVHSVHSQACATLPKARQDFIVDTAVRL